VNGTLQAKVVVDRDRNALGDLSTRVHLRPEGIGNTCNLLLQYNAKSRSKLGFDRRFRQNLVRLPSFKYRLLQSRAGGHALPFEEPGFGPPGLMIVQIV